MCASCLRHVSERWLLSRSIVQQPSLIDARTSLGARPRVLGIRNRVARDRLPRLSSVSTASSSAATSAAANGLDSKSLSRNVVVAVDNTVDAQRALEWTLKDIVRKGDTVHLVHVVSDTRTSVTAVDSTSSGLQWTRPGQDTPFLNREWVRRLEDAASEMVQSTFLPQLDAAHHPYKVHILKQRDVKSAAGIGELLCHSAELLEAQLLVVASHGAGVLADYGSVAQFCARNSRVPVALVPPCDMDTGCGVDQAGLLLVALDDFTGLERATRFAAAHFHLAGEALCAAYVHNLSHEEELHGQSGSNQEEPGQLVRSSVGKWAAAAGAVEALVEAVVVNDADNAEEDSMHSIVGERLCSLVAERNPRLVLLAHHDSGVMSEMLYGHTTAYFLRHCHVPLVVINQQ